MVNKGLAIALALVAAMVGLNMSGVVTIDTVKDTLNQHKVNAVGNLQESCLSFPNVSLCSSGSATEGGP